MNPSMARQSIIITFLFPFLVACVGTPRPAPVWGLRPEYPEALVGSVGHPSPFFVEVDSPQPVLRWQSFPRPEDSKNEKIKGITNVTYDLRIWRVTGPYRVRHSSLLDLNHYFVAFKIVEPIYEREGLPQPGHKIEEPLEPFRNYFWSIRARFQVDGQTRVSECSSAAVNLRMREGNIILEHPVPKEEQSCYKGLFGDVCSFWPEFGVMRQPAQIRNESYFRFKTPAIGGWRLIKGGDPLEHWPDR